MNPMNRLLLNVMCEQLLKLLRRQKGLILGDDEATHSTIDQHP